MLPLGLALLFTCGQPLPPCPHVCLPACQPTWPVTCAVPPDPRPNGVWAWLEADYVVGWLRGAPVPPLVTRGNGPANPGVLGRPGTEILFGGERVNDTARSGVRLVAGAWLDDCATCGIELRGLWLDEDKRGGTFGGPNQPFVSRPFINGITGLPDAQLVTLPGILGGTTTVAAESGPFYGADAVLRKRLCGDCCYRLDAIAGYRYLDYRDALRVAEDLAAEGALAGTRIQVRDAFQASNRFHGADLGLRFVAEHGCLNLDVQGRIAPGCLRRVVQIDGATVSALPDGTTTVAQGGLLAQSSNIGRYTSDTFVVVPEVSLSLGWEVVAGVRLRLGYTFLALPEVVRAGGQIDPVVNPNLIPPPVPGGPARPAFVQQTETLWLHGLMLGAEFRF